MNERLNLVLARMSELPEFVEISNLTPYTRGNFGNYPLHIAAIWGDVAAGQILLLNGADPNASGEHGYTPLHEAIEQEHIQFIELLLRHGASTLTKNDDGLTPVDLANFSKNELLKRKVCIGASERK